MQPTAARSPGRKRSTRGPTSVMTPTISCPAAQVVKGRGPGKVFVDLRSLFCRRPGKQAPGAPLGWLSAARPRLPCIASP